MFNLGRNHYNGAKSASYAGFTVGIGLSIITAILTVIFREDISRLYTEDQNVIALAVTLMLFSAMYQGMNNSH